MSEVKCSTCKGTKTLTFERGQRCVPCVTCSGSGIDWRKTCEAAQSELTALREELAQYKHMVGAVGATIPLSETLASMTTKQTMVDYFKGLHSERDDLRKRLTAAEQRNSVCKAEIVAMVESALRRSFSLGQVYWQQADSDSTCQQNKSDRTMEVQTQHILNVVKSINELTKPTESGASE